MLLDYRIEFQALRLSVFDLLKRKKESMSLISHSYYIEL